MGAAALLGLLALLAFVSGDVCEGLGLAAAAAVLAWVWRRPARMFVDPGWPRVFRRR